MMIDRKTYRRGIRIDRIRANRKHIERMKRLLANQIKYLDKEEDSRSFILVHL